MITYKNISFSAKTFYGVKFEPGEIKAVPGYINCAYMVRVNEPIPVITTEAVPAEPETIVVQEEPVQISTRGRKKKSNEPEKDSVAETETILELSKEETTDGN